MLYVVASAAALVSLYIYWHILAVQFMSVAQRIPSAYQQVCLRIDGSDLLSLQYICKAYVQYMSRPQSWLQAAGMLTYESKDCGPAQKLQTASPPGLYCC